MDFLDYPFVESFEAFFTSVFNIKGVFAPIFLLTAEESGLPLPIPGDIIIAYIGYKVSTGDIPYYLAFLLILLSVMTGSSILYFLSYRWGPTLILKLGKYIHLDEKKIITVEEKFRKYGPWVIIFGRHVPGFRIAITVFAGISKIKYSTFISSTFISVVFWIAFYLYLGARLGARTRGLLRGSFVHMLPFFITLLLIIGLIFFLHYHYKKNNSK